MSSSERARRIEHLRSPQEGEYVLLANAKCLTEGVDIPSLDAVIFCDPRYNQADLVQAIGRVLRRSDETGKTVGAILLPVAVESDAVGQEALDSSAYGQLSAVLRAIRGHDERMASSLDAARGEFGERRLRLARSALAAHVTIAATLDVTAFDDQWIHVVLNRTTSVWPERIGELRAFVELNGRTPRKSGHASESERNLAQWTGSQMTELSKGRLSAERAAELRLYCDANQEDVIEIAREALFEAAFANGARPVHTRSYEVRSDRTTDVVCEWDSPSHGRVNDYIRIERDGDFWVWAWREATGVKQETAAIAFMTNRGAGIATALVAKLLDRVPSLSTECWCSNLPPVVWLPAREQSKHRCGSGQIA
jgi:hypothetical protein